MKVHRITSAINLNPFTMRMPFVGETVAVHALDEGHLFPLGVSSQDTGTDAFSDKPVTRLYPFWSPDC